MSDHPSHKLSTYLDDRKHIVFCIKCGNEENGLEFECKPYPVMPLEPEKREFVSGLYRHNG